MFKNLKDIFSLFNGHRRKLLLALAFAIGSTIFGVIGPKIGSWIINELFYGLEDTILQSGSINFENVFKLLLLAAFIYIFGAGCQIIQSIICTNISKKVCYNLRQNLIHKINVLPIDYFEKETKGNMLSRVINDAETLTSYLSTLFIDIITSSTMIIGSVIMMLTISIELSLIIFLLIPLSIGFVLILVKLTQKIFFSQQNMLGELNGFIEERFSGLSMIKIFNKEKDSVKDFNKVNNAYYKLNLKSKIAGQIVGPLFSLVNNIAYVVVVIFGAYLNLLGCLTVGDIPAFVQYVGNFSSPLTGIMSSVSTIQQMAAASKRINDFLNLEDEDNIETNNKKLCSIDKKTETNPVISFKDVNFSYDKKNEIIKDFSLDINKGETIAIVGPTGAGKTTLVKLLMRFFDIDSGSISLYGKEITQYSRHEVRDNISMVLQDIWLFNGTIKENIEYGYNNKSSQKFKLITKLICVDDFVTKLKDKYNTKINESAKNLSLGQKQLISIARAIIADKDILILDEATSSIDTATEEKLYEAFNDLIQQKTSIVIAHRLSTIKNADKILVVNNGRIVEIGNHNELLKQKGFYYDLYMSSKR